MNGGTTPEKCERCDRKGTKADGYIGWNIKGGGRLGRKVKKRLVEKNKVGMEDIGKDVFEELGGKES